MGDHNRLCSSKAGIKKALAKSAVYPRQFGLAMAALVPRGGVRSESEVIDVDYPGNDHLDSLSDLTKGPHKSWWRKYTTGR